MLEQMVERQKEEEKLILKMAKKSLEEKENEKKVFQGQVERLNQRISELIKDIETKANRECYL